MNSFTHQYTISSTTSSTTGNALYCNNMTSGYVTYFSFITDSLPNNVLMVIRTNNGDTLEMVMYTLCENNGVPGNINNTIMCNSCEAE